VVEEVRVEEEEQEREEEPEKEMEKVEEEDEKEVIQRPKKKRKKEVVKKVKTVVHEVESEDEDMLGAIQTVEVLGKRGASVEQDDEENAPLRKKQKVEPEFEVTTKGKKMKKARRNIVERVEEVYPDEMGYDVPSLAHVRLTPASDLTPSPSPAPEVKRRPPAL
jgi:histone-lysine N-methyltransferase SETD1